MSGSEGAETPALLSDSLFQTSPAGDPVIDPAQLRRRLRVFDHRVDRDQSRHRTYPRRGVLYSVLSVFQSSGEQL
jgi:hypothetical protein